MSIQCQHMRAGARYECEQDSTFAVDYWNGTVGPISLFVCSAHLEATKARVWPGRIGWHPVGFSGPLPRA